MADICPPASGIGPVEPFATRFLDCETDSITVCLDSPIAVTGTFEQRELDCNTDSVTVCPPSTGTFDVEVQNTVDVNVLNEVNIRPLNCSTDSVEVCLDQPIAVSGTLSIDGDVEIKNPGVSGTVVPGSRWHATGFNSLAGTLTIVSPIPAGNQRVVCDWLDWSLVVASIGLGGTSLRPRVHDGTAAGPIIWQIAVGLAGLADLGLTYSGDSDGIVLQSSLGNQLTFQFPSGLTLFDKSINFGGYIVEV